MLRRAQRAGSPQSLSDTVRWQDVVVNLKGIEDFDIETARDRDNKSHHVIMIGHPVRVHTCRNHVTLFTKDPNDAPHGTTKAQPIRSHVTMYVTGVPRTNKGVARKCAHYKCHNDMDLTCMYFPLYVSVSEDGLMDFYIDVDALLLIPPRYDSKVADVLQTLTRFSTAVSDAFPLRATSVHHDGNFGSARDLLFKSPFADTFPLYRDADNAWNLVSNMRSTSQSNRSAMTRVTSRNSTSPRPMRSVTNLPQTSGKSTAKSIQKGSTPRGQSRSRVTTGTYRPTRPKGPQQQVIGGGMIM